MHGTQLELPCQSRTGGPFGTMRFDAEQAHGANSGIHIALSLLRLWLLKLLVALKFLSTLEERTSPSHLQRVVFLMLQRLLITREMSLLSRWASLIRTLSLYLVPTLYFSISELTTLVKKGHTSTSNNVSKQPNVDREDSRFLNDAGKDKHVFLSGKNFTFHAIESIKSTYKVNKVWTGDPFSPILFPWEGTFNYHIKSLMNLSSSGLQGPIAFSFRDLSLELLDIKEQPERGFFY
ncbi:unnamed protein product [Arabidopsis lyrata]|nr:unnamed protein product [Arabidopsis lyrata]